MEKKCCICGRTIPDGQTFYSIGANRYICCNSICYQQHFWDLQIEQVRRDTNHEYVIINQKLYKIGSEKDEPRGMSGRNYTIQFENGSICATNSLWLIGKIPKPQAHFLKDNAKFI